MTLANEYKAWGTKATNSYCVCNLASAHHFTNLIQGKTEHMGQTENVLTIAMSISAVYIAFDHIVMHKSKLQVLHDQKH